MTDLSTELTTLRSRMSRIRQRLEFERAAATRIDSRLVALEAEKLDLVKAVTLIDQTIGVVSANGIGRIESTVSNGLRLVFGDPSLSLKVIKNEGKRGNSYEIVGRQLKGEEWVEGPFLETFGGGVANVASFLLQVLIQKRFKMAKVFILDERFNNVSAQALPKVSKLLRSLAHDGGYTILAVTHQPILAMSADRIYSAVPGPGDMSPMLEEITHQQLSDEMLTALDSLHDPESDKKAVQSVLVRGMEQRLGVVPEEMTA
jgi:hypothetical protein